MLTPANQLTLAQRLTDLYAPIANDLARTEALLQTQMKSKIDFIADLTAHVQKFKGKRLRPALMLLSAKAVGEVRPIHHTLATVIEMVHIATLVHDDVLDEAECRHHVPTVNADWNNETSVLLGDYLLSHALYLAAGLDSTFACRVIGKATNIVCEGELHQIARRGRFDLTEEEYWRIIEGKTAELIACCCQLGAHFGGASRAVENALEQYGREVGIAFQIADDLLDLLSDEKITGKSTGTDLAKQKITLPLIRFREVATPAAVRRCQQIFLEVGPGQREAILALLDETDAIAYAQARAREYADRAIARLAKVPDNPARDTLLTLAQFTVERSA